MLPLEIVFDACINHCFNQSNKNYFQVEKDNGVCELIIDNVGRFDGGGYRCVAENEYGSARTTCEVNVQCEFLSFNSILSYN